MVLLFFFIIKEKNKRFIERIFLLPFHKNTWFIHLSYMRFLYLILGLFVLFSFPAKASNVDSLLQTLQIEKHDTNTVNTLIALSLELRSNYPDSASIYAQKALSISEKLGFARGINDATYELAVIEYYRRNYEKSLEYVEINKDFLKRDNSNPRTLVRTLIIEGNVYKNLGEHAEAIKIYNQCLNIAEKEKDHHLWIVVSNNKANIYRRQGNHDEALKIYEKALDLCKKYNLEEDKILILTGISLVYKEQKDYETALFYYEQILITHQKGNDKRSMSIILNNIGNIYSEQKKYNQALKTHQEALKLRQEIGDLTGEAKSLTNIANIYLKAFRDYNKALEYALKGLEINQNTNSILDISNSFIVIANIYKEQKNYAKAIENAKKGLDFIKDIDELQLKQIAYETLAISYEATNDYKAAVFYFKAFQEVKDSIFSQTNRDAIIDLNRKYRAEQYQQELENQQTLLEKEKTKRYFYLGIILFLIALAILGFYTIRQKQLANQQLQHLNEEVKAQNDELLMAQNRLKVANQDLNSFTRMASHDLKEPLRMMASFSQLLKRKNKNLDESSQEYINYITDAAQRMNRMIDGMLNYATNNVRLENMNFLDMNQVLATVQQNLKLRIEENNAIIKVQQNLPSINGQDSLIEQLFQNLIANAIKFQRPNVQPEIIVTAEDLTNETVFRIKDNGIGIAAENQAKVFQLFKRFNQEYEGSGIGLATCKKIVELHNGMIELESKEGEGTTFILKFPK